jgi:ATP-binding cassette subfamily B protein
VDAIRRFFADQAIGVADRAVVLGQPDRAVDLEHVAGAHLVVVVPVIVVVSVLFFRWASRHTGEPGAEAALSTTLQENLTGVRVVKAFARQEYERKKFEKENGEKFQRGRRLTLMHAMFWPVTDTLCQAQMLAGFLIGALMAIRGEITLGDYIAYVGVLVWLIWPMRELGRLIVQMSSGLVSYGRVVEVLKQEREPINQGRYEPTLGLRGEIVFDDVCFKYDDSDTSVLKDINFRCEPGKAVALLGSTGSGKTTLVNLLPRFYEYTGGSVRLDGVELSDYSRRFLRQNIGIVEQEPFLFSRSIRENITYGVGRDVSDAEVQAAARAAAIHDVVRSFPDGYSTLVREG